LPLGYREPPERREPKHTGESTPDWQPPPGALGANQAHQRETNLEESGILQLIEDTTRESREARYTDPEVTHWRYRARPLGVTITFGALAVLLIVGQHWLPEVGAALGGAATGFGWLRFAMFVVGAYCAFMAWPDYRSVFDKPDDPRPPPPRLRTRR
jgi:hypothetical protein